MDENGKKADVMTECGIDMIDVWADNGMKTTIETVPGVVYVVDTSGTTHYQALVDHRYDAQVVAKNIELAILLKIAILLKMKRSQHL